MTPLKRTQRIHPDDLTVHPSRRGRGIGDRGQLEVALDKGQRLLEGMPHPENWEGQTDAKYG